MFPTDSNSLDILCLFIKSIILFVTLLLPFSLKLHSLMSHSLSPGAVRISSFSILFVLIFSLKISFIIDIFVSAFGPLHCLGTSINMQAVFLAISRSSFISKLLHKSEILSLALLLPPTTTKRSPIFDVFCRSFACSIRSLNFALGYS